MSTNRLFMVLACLGMGLFSGCHCREPKPPEPTPSPTAEVVSPGPAQHNLTRSLVFNSLPKNSAAPEILKANEQLLKRLKDNALNGVKIDDVEPFTLTPRNAELEELAILLMEYVVSFALKRGQEVHATLHGVPYTWPGNSGACAGTDAPLGDWFTGKPSQQCLEAVTASVLARVNALGKVVLISMRGPKNLLALEQKVPVQTTLREKDPTTRIAMPIESFNLCDGKTNDCGWTAQYVGQCIAAREGESEIGNVTLKLKPTTAMSPPVMVRVCKGIHGCNADDKYGHADAKRYVGYLKSEYIANSEVKFTCPLNGPIDSHGGRKTTFGYFSIMLRKTSVETPEVDVEFEVSDGVVYPASEEQVFRYREGAFYGDLFEFSDNKQVASGQPAKPVLFDKQYACYGEDWNRGMAHLADRLCALPESTPDEMCFVNKPFACLSGSDLDRCKVGSNHYGSSFLDPVVYNRCGTWRYPLTVYLNHPCDLESTCSSLEKWSVSDKTLPIAPDEKKDASGKPAAMPEE